jgi:hypothetical protein
MDTDTGVIQCELFDVFIQFTEIVGVDREDTGKNLQAMDQ